MTGWIFLGVILVAIAVIWTNLARHPHPEAKLGPDGTNVREPESFVVHHEGKAQGLDIANTALKEYTRNIQDELVGDRHKIKVPIPGRDPVMMDAPPSDESKYGDLKVAPGAVPGMPGGETKEKVLMEGPKGSRPGPDAEEPGSPGELGRRVTDNYRDQELAAELHPEGDHGRKMVGSPSTNGKEPGYGLGRTRPGQTDGEGGRGSAQHANTPDPVEQPDLQDEIPDNPHGEMPAVAARGRGNGGARLATAHQEEYRHPQSEVYTPQVPAKIPAREYLFETSESLEPELGGEIFFNPDPSWAGTRVLDGDPLPEENISVEAPGSYMLIARWKVGGSSSLKLRQTLGDTYQKTNPVLRVYDVTPGEVPHSFTMDIGPDEYERPITAGIQPGHRYVVSYERMTPDGQTFMVTHSEPVETPPPRPNLVH